MIEAFIGDNYQEGIQGKKILILGESSYHPEQPKDINSHTQNLANDAIGYDNGKGYWNKSRFYTRIARIFGFNPRDYIDREKFWHSVSYYNYLQVVLTQPREAIPAGAWEQAEKPYLSTIQKLNPDCIIVWSKRLWSHLPKESEENVNAGLNTFAVKANYKIDSQKECKLFGFKHPTSFGFRWQDVKSILDKQI